MESLSTYTTRDRGSASWAISCVLPSTGMPVPMSRNWRTPRLARWRTTRLRKHRLARTPATIWGRSFMTCSPTVLSAGKWSFPPSQKLQTLAACAVCGSNRAVERPESRALLRMKAVAPRRFGAVASRRWPPVESGRMASSRSVAGSPITVVGQGEVPASTDGDDLLVSVTRDAPFPSRRGRYGRRRSHESLAGHGRACGRGHDDRVSPAAQGDHLALRGVQASPADEQGTGASKEERIIGHVCDLAPGRDLLGDVMRVAGGGQAGADVEERGDTALAGQVPHRPGKEVPAGAHPRDDLRASGRTQARARHLLGLLPQPSPPGHGRACYRRLSRSPAAITLAGDDL